MSSCSQLTPQPVGQCLSSVGGRGHCNSLKLVMLLNTCSMALDGASSEEAFVSQVRDSRAAVGNYKLGRESKGRIGNPGSQARADMTPLDRLEKLEKKLQSGQGLSTFDHQTCKGEYSRMHVKCSEPVAKSSGLSVRGHNEPDFNIEGDYKVYCESSHVPANLKPSCTEIGNSTKACIGFSRDINNILEDPIKMQQAAKDYSEEDLNAIQGIPAQNATKVQVQTLKNTLKRNDPEASHITGTLNPIEPVSTFHYINEKALGKSVRSFLNQMWITVSNPNYGVVTTKPPTTSVSTTKPPTTPAPTTEPPSSAAGSSAAASSASPPSTPLSSSLADTNATVYTTVLPSTIAARSTGTSNPASTTTTAARSTGTSKSASTTTATAVGVTTPFNATTTEAIEDCVRDVLDLSDEDINCQISTPLCRFVNNYTDSSGVPNTPKLRQAIAQQFGQLLCEGEELTTDQIKCFLDPITKEFCAPKIEVIPEEDKGGGGVNVHVIVWPIVGVVVIVAAGILITCKVRQRNAERQENSQA